MWKFNSFWIPIGIMAREKNEMGKQLQIVVCNMSEVVFVNSWTSIRWAKGDNSTLSYIICRKSYFEILFSCLFLIATSIMVVEKLAPRRLLCVYLYMYIYLCVHIIYTYIYIYIYIYIYVFLNIYIYIYMYVYIYIYM